MKKYYKITILISLLVFIATKLHAEQITNYVVRGDKVNIYAEIIKDPSVTQSTEALIYGNPFSGKPVADNPQWIELSPPIGNYHFIRAENVIAEVPYEKCDGQFLIIRDWTFVYLEPNGKAQVVLKKLVKGEVLPSTGVYKKGKETWYRFKFETDKRDPDRYFSNVGERIGWIYGENVQLLEKNLNQSVVKIDEIPRASRNTRKFSDEERYIIAKRGFFIERLVPPNPYELSENVVDDMVDVYVSDKNKYETGTGPRFITADLFLHCYHLIFDYMLQDIEMKKLLPVLKDITVTLYNAAEKTYETSKDAQIQAAAKRNMWFFGVGAALLNLEIPISPMVKADVEKEVLKIHDAAKESLPTIDAPNQEHEYLPGFKEDYTQYKPRGHYTIKKELESYFRTMIHYGRKSFMIKDPSCTLSAILITKDVYESDVQKQWEEFSKVIDFIVGKSDDWTPKDYQRVMDEVYKATEAKRYTDPAKLKEFQKKAIEKLSPQKIVSQQTRISLDSQETQQERLLKTAGFKFLGQRYTPDAEYFQRLTSPAVGTDAEPKNLPTCLEVMALLGSKKGFDLIPHAWWERIRNYRNAYQQTEAMIGSHNDASWNESAYMQWLFTLKSLFLTSASKQLFANGDAWGYKTLNTALGSWTELKHDTLLYSEQSYAEQGGGAEEEGPAAAYALPSIKSYIEPNREFFQRVSQLNSLTLSMVGRAGFLTDEYKEKFEIFGTLVERAKDIVIKEIANNTITEDDYLWMLELPWKFDKGLLLPREAGEIINREDLQMALVADVATDAFNGKVLIEAVGYPQKIIVLVKDYWGGTRITEGFIFSHYEFTDTKRWNDKEWRTKVYSPDGQSALEEMEHTWYKQLRN